jgi:apolipoprotein D and lipocalin family protein
MKTFLFLPVLLLLTACASGTSGRAPNAPPPQTVAAVDLNRYAGLWFEIARYPNSFQRNCQGVTAEYTLRDDGRIGVINTCRSTDRPGSPRSARAVASVIEGSNGAKIAVNFAPIPLPKGQGNYWVLHLEPDYSLALVGSPSGEYLWLLSRTPFISLEQKARVMATAVAQGFDVSMLVNTQQYDLNATPP